MFRLAISIILMLMLSVASAVRGQVSSPPLRGEAGRGLITLPDSVAEGYVAFGERYLHKAWAELPDSVFAQFKKNGNRVNYEAICFERRRQLAALVMAEVVEGEGRFINDILNGIDVHLNEPWWGIPAHYSKAKPDKNIQTVDLFNAETASLIVWTKHLLGSQLEYIRKGICDSIDAEITHRILIPAVSENYWWKRAVMNWNPWICSNWLACIAFCEHNEERRNEAYRQIGESLKIFVDSYPDDGGCDEGPGYWDRAAASLFECLQWHDFKGLDHEKIKKMGAYIYKLYIGNDYCVNFADSHTNKSVQQINILYPFALYANDTIMRQFAAYMFQGSKFKVQSQSTRLNSSNSVTPLTPKNNRTLAQYYETSGNFPTLGREVVFLRHFDQLAQEPAKEPLLKNVWLDKLQIMTARQEQGSKFKVQSSKFKVQSSKFKVQSSNRVSLNLEPGTWNSSSSPTGGGWEGASLNLEPGTLNSFSSPTGGGWEGASLFIAMKGGNNDESHNHNDVGSFIVYADGEPLLIDVGVGEYTSQTFSADRYSIWTMQSAYHNLPTINGINQKNGKQYKASNVEYSPGRLTMDIAGAYPEEAKINHWTRTVALNDAQVDVTEDYQFEQILAPSQINLITPLTPTVKEKKNRILLGNRTIIFPHKQLKASVEDISGKMDTLLQGLWGDHLYRITLTLTPAKQSGRITYTIK